MLAILAPLILARPVAGLRDSTSLGCLARGSHEWLATRASPLDSVALVVGGTAVQVCYSRPRARGRAIDSLIPAGVAWRTGANEPTTVTLSGPATIGGARLAAGRYVLLTVPGAETWTLVFHTTPETEAGRMFATLHPVAQGTGRVERALAPVEQFTIRAEAPGGAAALVLEWSDRRVRVPVADVPDRPRRPAAEQVVAADEADQHSSRQHAATRSASQLNSSVRRPQRLSIRMSLVPRGAALILVVLGAQGCDRRPPVPPLVDALTRASTAVTAETLHVRPPEADSLGAPYPGTSLDTAFYAAFVPRYAQLKEKGPDELSALFRVPLGHGRTGFVLRVPSQYSSSAADLWVYDPSRHTWEPPVHVADAFGDGMWYFVEDGWIVDVDGDGYRDVVRRRRDTWVDEETNKAGQSDTLWVSRGGPHGFQSARPAVDARLLRTFDVPKWEPLRDEPAADSAPRPRQDSTASGRLTNR